MAIGQRIKLFRKRKGYTQKELGEKLGFTIGSDVRMAQYEKEARVPKGDLVNHMASLLDVSPMAIKVPDIETEYNVMHTLFAIEDMYGINLFFDKKTFSLYVNYDRDNRLSFGLYERMMEWGTMKERLLSGEVTREQYDEWRYMYPERSEGFIVDADIKNRKFLRGYDVLMGRSLDQKYSKTREEKQK